MPSNLAKPRTICLERANANAIAIAIAIAIENDQTRTIKPLQSNANDCTPFRRQPNTADMRTARTARFYLDQALSAGSETTLDKPASHHLVNVLRAGVGDHIELFNGDGFDYTAQIVAAGKRCRVTVHQAMSNACESPIASTLIQAISRGDRMDTSLQKAVELGINDIQPVYSRHSISPLDASRGKRKLAHWRNILISACEQSGRSRLPTVHTPTPLQAWLQDAPPRTPGELRYVLAPDADNSLGGVVAAVNQFAVLVGPESGFDSDEMETALQADFEPLRLGPRVLRTETAGPAALAILQARHGDMACY